MRKLLEVSDQDTIEIRQSKISSLILHVYSFLASVKHLEFGWKLVPTEIIRNVITGLAGTRIITSL